MNRIVFNNRPSLTSRRDCRRLLTISFSMALLFFCSVAWAAGTVPKSQAVESPKYEVVPGGEDKAYLLNTVTGFVWVLTYRTTATGREPIAIPYKFIKICPGNSKEFIVEDAKDGACLPKPGI